MSSEPGAGGKPSADTDPSIVIPGGVPGEGDAPASGKRPGLIVWIVERVRQTLESFRSKHEERRYARRVSLEALEAYRRVHAQHPDLRGKALYGEVIVSQGLMNAGTAEALILAAQQSFSDWPIARDLRFQDVVHYMVYEAYMREYRSRHWTLADIGAVVAAVIPEDL